MRPIGLGPQMVRRLWQVASFIDTRMVKPLVLGGDELTRELNIVDAASFSAAIPGVLHHETKDPAMVPLLDDYLASKDVAALVDGGAASNVPAEQAWLKVQRGRIGTRNATYLALDCFHPQLDPRHLWLTPDHASREPADGAQRAVLRLPARDHPDPLADHAGAERQGAGPGDRVGPGLRRAGDPVRPRDAGAGVVGGRRAVLREGHRAPH